MSIFYHLLRPLSVALLTGALGIAAPALGQQGSTDGITTLTPLTGPDFVSASDFGMRSFRWDGAEPLEGAEKDQASAAALPSLRLDFAPFAPIWARVTPSEFGVYAFLVPGDDLSRARARLRDLIATVEAGPEAYDAVQGQARVRPSAPATTLTIAQVFDWIRETPGQHHAIGRYQVIPSTLAELVRALDVPPSARYTPALQDRMADHLMDAAGLPAFCNGTTSLAQFQNRLARIWAGLPTTAGRSHYEGYAGNTAHMTASKMANALADAKALCRG
jgi:hypothetical protein